MKTTIRKTIIFSSLVAIALTSSSFAGPRLSEHELLAKNFEEDLSFVTFTFISDQRWYDDGRLNSLEKEFLDHLSKTKKCAVAIGTALRCHESSRALVNHIRMTRESLDCISTMARRMNLGRKTETFLASAMEGFDELESCIAPPPVHRHSHTRVDPDHRNDHFERDDFRRERTAIDSREIAVRSLFERIRERH